MLLLIDVFTRYCQHVFYSIFIIIIIIIMSKLGATSFSFALGPQNLRTGPLGIVEINGKVETNEFYSTSGKIAYCPGWFVSLVPVPQPGLSNRDEC